MYSRTGCSYKGQTTPTRPSSWLLERQTPSLLSRIRSPQVLVMAQRSPAAGSVPGTAVDSSASQPRWWSRAVAALPWGHRPESQIVPVAAGPVRRRRPVMARLFSRSAAAADAASGDTATSHGNSSASPRHLIVMANGLFGTSSNWDVICEQLKDHLDPSDTLLHPSLANSMFETYEGIDRCGTRLAQEIRNVVSMHDSLERISIIAHSMGGLIARYALGLLYNPASRTVCGLEPCHFVTLATPHLGCDADGVAQVPFIGWTGGLPLLGPHLFRVLQDISASTAAVIFKDTGKQFFMLDGGSTPGQQHQQQLQQAGSRGDDSGSTTAHLPVLLQMTQDCPDRGLCFYSALSAFKTRTCYANMDGDHLVGYANSSIRSLHELPPPPPAAATAKGVVLEDPITAAFFPQQWQQLQQAAQQHQLDRTGSGHAAASAAATVTAVSDVIRQSYQPSKHWTPAAAAAAAPGAKEAAAVPTPVTDRSTGWHQLEAAQRSSSSGGGGARVIQQQEGASVVATLELAAAGAAAAATEAVADLLAPLTQQEQQQQQSAPKPGDSNDEFVQIGGTAPASTSAPEVQAGIASSSLALSRSASAESEQQAAAAEQDLTSGLSAEGSAAEAADSRESAVQAVAADAAQVEGSMTSRAQMVTHMLHRLQELPWRRIDVSFRGARFGYAHNNIQVTRRWWNFEGEQVPRHLAQQLQIMEQLVKPTLTPNDSSVSDDDAKEAATPGLVGKNVHSSDDPAAADAVTPGSAAGVPAV